MAKKKHTDWKDMTVKELKRKALELVAESPVLKSDQEKKRLVIQAVKSMADKGGLVDLCGILADESKDWKVFLQNYKKQSEKLTKRVKAETTGFKKKADRMVMSLKETKEKAGTDEEAEGLLEGL